MTPKTKKAFSILKGLKKYSEQGLVKIFSIPLPGIESWSSTHIQKLKDPPWIHPIIWLQLPSG